MSSVRRSGRDPVPAFDSKDVRKLWMRHYSTKDRRDFRKSLDRYLRCRELFASPSRRSDLVGSVRVLGRPSAASFSETEARQEW